jgi:hypothetical protein
MLKYYDNSSKWWVKLSLNWVDYDSFKQIDLVANDKAHLFYSMGTERCNFDFWIDKNYLFYNGQKVLGISADEFNSSVLRRDSFNINDYKLEPFSKNQLLEQANNYIELTGKKINKMHSLFIILFSWIWVLGLSLFAYRIIIKKMKTKVEK